MTYKDFFKEYNMSQVPVGGQPSISGQSGTYASPDVTQNPGSFPADGSNVNIVPPVDQDVKSKIDPETYKKDVEDVKRKVTPDDVIQGLQYELKKQIYKNKMVAKETVVQNLKKNPRYYRDLGMLGMTPDMMNESTCKCKDQCSCNANDQQELDEKLDLNMDRPNNKIVVVSTLENPREAGNETYRNKDALKANGFRWDGSINAWTIDADKFGVATSVIRYINSGYKWDFRKNTWIEPAGDSKLEDLIQKIEDLPDFILGDANISKKQELADKIEAFIKELADAVHGATTTGKVAEYLAFTRRFRKYSFNNSLLIFIQRPTATYVAGFNAWKKMGVTVNKGAKAIYIYAPIIKKGDDVKVNEPGVETEINKNNVMYFRAVPVFDIGDTNAAEIGVKPTTPEWHDNNTPSELADKLFEYAVEFCKDKGIKITHDDAKGGEMGWALGDHINLSSNIAGVNKLATLIHEIAHSLLHFKDSSVFFGDEYTLNLTKEQAELQAESVSFTVLRNYDLPVKHQATYLAMWKADKDAVIKNMTVIKKVANFIIDGIDVIANEKEKPAANENTQREKIGQILRDLSIQKVSKERVEQKYGNFDAIKKLMDEKWEEKKQRRNYNG